MTIFLKNMTNNQSITLRYGDGLNQMLQINAGAKIELPAALNRGLLQHYLSTFKGALKVIDSNQPESMKGLNDDVKETNETESQVSEEETETQNGEESDDDQLSDDGDPETGDVNPAGEEQVVTSDQAGEESEEESEEEQVGFTEKELSKLSAGEIKELAIKLGIEVTEESTKKALIPVILNKQGN